MVKLPPISLLEIEKFYQAIPHFLHISDENLQHDEELSRKDRREDR